MAASLVKSWLRRIRTNKVVGKTSAEALCRSMGLCAGEGVAS